MQPYFFPYIGYFSLIKHTEKFILLDEVQFIRHGWIERNRIVKKTGGWQYFQVPIIKPQGRDTLIKDIKINNNENWQGRILAQLQHYKKRAPFYNQTVDLLKCVFASEYDDIVQLNKSSLSHSCEYLGINTPILVFSEMNLTIQPVTSADEWALNICKAIEGVSEYWNPVGGESFFDPQKYQQAGIDLLFQHMDISPYNQFTGTFEPGLSIIDVLMYNSVNEVNQMLDKFTMVSL